MRSLILFLSLALGLGASAAPPNIVMIISDDQSWTDYGFMGHHTIQTPHLDQLAEQSYTFSRGYVPTALCRPSLATLITGLYTHQHKISGNDPSLQLAQRDSPEYAKLREQLIANLDDVPKVPEILGELGYLSHQSGKWWEGSWKRGGFTHGMTRGFPERGGRHGDDGLKIGREGMEPVTDFIDEAVAAKKPFFVWYAPFLPHTPHNPPERLLKKYDTGEVTKPVAKYYAMCEWFDETCGQLLDHLDTAGVAENTLVVYVTDNGWIQNPDKNGYAPRSKQSPNEGGTRTPIMFRWPGVIPPKMDADNLCSSIDIVPTMLAAAGAEIPDGLPGLDLNPVLKGEAELERDTIFGEGCAHDVRQIDDPEASLLYRWVIEGKWKLLLTYDGEVGRYKSSHLRTEMRPQLFDLMADPHENKNLAKENPEVVARLAKKIADWYPVKERKVIETWTN